MQLSRRNFFKQAALSGLALSTMQAQWGQARALKNLADEVHFLNRIAYSVQPEELSYLREIGLEAYLDEQLHPERLIDDEAQRRLSLLPALTMNRQTLFSLANSDDRAYRSLLQGFLLRAIYSKKQLLERVTEFWTDHFNVPSSIDSPANVILLQQDIRKHGFGSFRHLLLATAKSPAMLYYLDNAFSYKEDPNENYARELMELHTLGVDGGYTEQDVEEVARAFTGWTVHDRSETGFYFNADMHDTEAKRILGHALPAGRGIEDGLSVVSILAEHPSTARFICTKLCQKFVSDKPPTELIEQLVSVWQANKGELKPVLRSLFLSDAFFASQGQKLRRPLDYFVAASRVTGTEILEFWETRESLEELGQIPYDWEPPNGYPEAAGAWMGTNSLLARWNLANKLTHDANSSLENWNFKTNLQEQVAQTNTIGELVEEVSKQVFGIVLSQKQLEPFVAYASEGAGPSEPATAFLRGRKLMGLFGLMLSSPEFQWR